ncbi:MAG: hypothetical protein KJP11_08700 [Gammaproteobacteria bacterium]|nr:hypothetical protein [Gammaproteobacteria bacterium]
MASPAVDSIVGLDRFQNLWRRCLVDGGTDDSASIHQRLINSYCEPQRHYHTLAHIEHCLGMFDQCKSLVSNPDALEIAVWFHDVIYEPGRLDNEALSKELYLYLSIKVHTAELRDLVGRLIMATLHDGSSLEDDDARYMVDIDLSSFGLSWDEFLKDSENLRLENPQLSDTEYYFNQGNFQNYLLGRERFYLSDFFRQRYESRARENLARYFERIRQSS